MSSQSVVAAVSNDGVPRRPDRRPRQTIRKVLAAGLTELRVSSYAGMTMRGVATRAGVSPASAYRYFPSKNALVATIYRNLLSDAPLHVDVNETTTARVTATMHDMALVGADEPELTAACATALMADDAAVTPVRVQIAAEVSRRIRSALGPGWPDAVISTLHMTYAGALMGSRFLPYEQVAIQLDKAVELILGGADA